VDCVGGWTAWTECNAQCGAHGTTGRTFEVSVAAAFGGAVCDVVVAAAASAGGGVAGVAVVVEESRHCNRADCPCLAADKSWCVALRCVAWRDVARRPCVCVNVRGTYVCKCAHVNVCACMRECVHAYSSPYVHGYVAVVRLGIGTLLGLANRHLVKPQQLACVFAFLCLCMCVCVYACVCVALFACMRGGFVFIPCVILARYLGDGYCDTHQGDVFNTLACGWGAFGGGRCRRRRRRRRCRCGCRCRRRCGFGLLD
jgi:hypothetical protein